MPRERRGGAGAFELRRKILTAGPTRRKRELPQISENKMATREESVREDTARIAHAHSEPKTDADQLARQRVELKVQELKRRCADVVPSPTEIELRDAVTRGRPHHVRRLLGEGVDLDNCHLHGSPVVLLAVATKKANPEVVSLLLENGADVNAVNVYGMTALHSVCIENHSPACVRLLLEAGADVDARDLEGRTPLHWAAWSHLRDVVGALLAAGAQTGLRCWGGEWAGKTPLDLATTCAISEMLRQTTAAAAGNQGHSPRTLNNTR